MSDKNYCQVRVFTGVKIVVLVILISIFTHNGSALALEDTHGHESAAHSDSGHDEHPLNWFDIFNKDAPPLIALFVNFIVLVVLLYFILRNSLSARFRNRHETLEREIKEALEMKAKAEKALKEARAKKESIDQEMAKIREEILSAGQAESAQLKAEAETQASRLRADATAMIDQQLAKMTHEIREDIADEVVALAERLIRERISKIDRDRLVNEYLNEIAPRTSSIPAEGWDGR